MKETIIALLVFLVIAVVWQYISAPEPLKTIGWIVIGVAFLLKFILPLLQ